MLKKLTFNVQIYIALTFVILGFVLSTITKEGWFSNVGCVIYGLFFTINPVLPQWARGDAKKLKLALRIVGIIVIIVSSTAHFGFDT